MYDALLEITHLPLGATLDRVLARACHITRGKLDGPADVSVMLGDPRWPTAVASTSARAQAIDGAQLVVGAGPAVAAFETAETVRTDDIAADARWPNLHGVTVAVGTAATVCPISVRGETVGVLATYAPRPVGVMVPELMSIGIAGYLKQREQQREIHRLSEDLERALSSRAVIDQAKGVPMAAYQLDADRAWDMLVALSSRSNTKVRAIAHDLVERASTGRPLADDDLPPVAHRAPRLPAGRSNPDDACGGEREALVAESSSAGV